MPEPIISDCDEQKKGDRNGNKIFVPYRFIFTRKKTCIFACLINTLHTYRESLSWKNFHSIEAKKY